MKKLKFSDFENKIVAGHQVYDSGSSEPPIIFIHGFPFDYTSWTPQIDYFKSDYRVVAYDIRGFGGTDRAIEPPSIASFANDLIAIMNELQIDKAVICGLSMGGYIALNAISRYPERINGLVLADTQCEADTEEAYQKRYKTIEHISAQGLETFTTTFIAALFGSQTYKSNKHLVETITSVVRANDVKVVISTLQALAERAATCDILPSIKVPTLLIYGSEDRITPPSKGRSMQRSIAKATFAELEGAGHLANLESPEEFNLQLANFLRQNIAFTLG